MDLPDCIEQNKRQVPLIKAVKAAITDTWGNISELQQLFSHWGARELKQLQMEVLKVGKTKVLIQVNRNTMTGTLPIDFGQDLFVGYIRDGKKISLKLSSRIADVCNIQEIPFEDTCTSCGQDKTICEDLSVTEEVTLVVINDNTYENKVIKKLYPNGDYYLETTKWYADVETGVAVQAPTQKEFITNFGLQPCGCLQQTEENIQRLQTHCYDCYSCNYACHCNEKSNYEYAIFEDTGLIQLDYDYPYDFVYLEYLGFMPKRNGQYMVPEVAFETIVEAIKLRSIKDKKGVERWRIQDKRDDYKMARKTMMRLLTSVSISQIVSAMRSIPKFNIDYNDSWYRCFDNNAFQNTASLLSGASGGSSSGGGSGSGGDNTTIINNYPTTIINNGSYQLAVLTGSGAGHPVNGASTYQNDLLKNSSDTEFIIVAKTIYSKINGDFSINTTTGVVDISPNAFFDGDSLIIPYNKIS